MITLTEIKKEIKSRGYWKNSVNFGTGFGAGISPHIDYKKVKRAWEKLPKTDSLYISCYSPYFMKNKRLIEKTGWNYHVAYPPMPIWFPEFADEFNNFFEHIKLEIRNIRNVKIFIAEQKGIEWLENGTKEVKNYIITTSPMGLKRGKYVVKNLTYPLVKFHYDDGYDPVIKYLFNYSVVILIRILSYGEKFHNPLQRKPSDKMKFLVKLNNENKGYRSFSETDITLEQLKKLDDIDLLNSNKDKVFDLKSKNYVKQTDFINVVTGGNYVKRTNFEKDIETARKLEEARAKNYNAVPGCNCGACRKARGEK
jgi:hypothetical protein